MKLYSLLALFGVTAAVRIGHNHVVHQAVQVQHQHISPLSIKNSFLQSKLNLPEKLTEEQEMEIVEWVIEELGGGTITKQEAHDALVAFLDKHGFDQPTPEEWDFLEAMFDKADKNGDGEIDLKEFVFAMAGQKEGGKKKGPKGKKKGPKGKKDLQLKAKKFLQTKLVLPEKLTKEQEIEIMEWVIDELGGGTITKQEAHDALIGFLDKHGYPQPTPEEWEMLEAMFDYVDKNGDGEIDLKEFAMAMAGPDGPPEGKKIQLFLQTKLKLPAKLTPEQELEIMEWVIDELGGGTITKQEAHDALVAFLDKHGFPQPTPEEWEMLEAIFDHVDKNGDGEIDLKEFAMAMAGPPPKK